jgi:tight adherence protein C
VGGTEATGLPVFMAASSVTLCVLMLVAGRRTRIDVRLEAISRKGRPFPDHVSVKEFARSTLPKLGAPFMPEDKDERTRLQARLIHAGFYSHQAIYVFLGVKMALILAAPIFGLAAGLFGIVPLRDGLIFGAFFGIAGMVCPSLWLKKRKAARQVCFCRALPDALDVLVICLEAGLSLPGALRRVAGELQTAHPVLALEFGILERQMQLGCSAGEALRQFTDRADLEEVRSLGSVIIQAEKFGASFAKVLRAHAEALRQKRLFSAEEMAQKAAIKMFFPTVFCIFPSILVIILGPPAIQIMQIMANFAK